MASNNPSSSNAVAGALTYPAGSNAQMEPAPEQPRQPITLQGLLRFAIEATKAEDAPENLQLGPMDPERRRFLDHAMNAHLVRLDEILKKNISILTDVETINNVRAGQSLPEQVLFAFQELGEYIDDIDVANDFEKMGGFTMFPLCFASDNVELRRWANLTLALVCQNNPRCQERALRSGLLSLLLHWLRERHLGDRSLRAISSLIRNYEPAMHAFLEEGGCEALVGALGNGDHCELASAAFLVTYLCRNSEEARDVFMKTNAVHSIADALKSRRTDASEYLLNILVTLLETQPAVASVYRDPSLDLRRTLEEHLRIHDVRNGRYIEEKEHCERILRVVFENQVLNGKPDGDEQDVEPADR